LQYLLSDTVRGTSHAAHCTQLAVPTGSRGCQTPLLCGELHFRSFPPTRPDTPPAAALRRNVLTGVFQ
jgi:hypothetical protein